MRWDANPEYVQAAGGNTSVKSPDGRTMAIKASGTALTAMSETEGWVELDVAAVLSVLDRRDLAALPAKEREARILELPARRGYRAARAGPRSKPRCTPCSAGWWFTRTRWQPMR